MKSKLNDVQPIAADSPKRNRNAKPAPLLASDNDWRTHQARERAQALEDVSAALNTIGPAFALVFGEVAAQAYKTSVHNGFWEDVHGSAFAAVVASKLALIHSEVSEALEAYREGKTADDKIPGFSGIEAELADAIIRIMDLSAALDLNVGAALVEKMQFNLTRPVKHGKQF